MSTTKLRVHTWPEKILKRKTKKVTQVDNTVRILLEEMLVLMRVSGGAGLAANQAGLDLQMLVVEAQDKVFKLINPRITRKEGSLVFLEGCLSFPGLELQVKRNKRLWVSALDENGEPIELEVEDLVAVIFQHEIDHINGIAFIDRISFWQKIKIYPKLKAIARRTKRELRKQKEKS